MNHEGNTSALPVRQVGGLIQPAAEAEAIRETFNIFERLKVQLLTREDYQRVGDKNFIKRSGWRKLGTAFSVSFHIVDRAILRGDAAEVLAAEFVVRAIAPNGRYAEAFAACDRWDRCCQEGCQRNHGKRGGKPVPHCGGRVGWGEHAPCDGGSHYSKPEHDIPATAQTRATSRAAADLFGMGDVPADDKAERPRVDEETGEILGPDGKQKARLQAIVKDKPDAYADALSRREVATAMDLPSSKIDELIAELEAADARP